MTGTKFFIGIDISNLTLDIAVTADGAVLESLAIPNTLKAIQGLFVRLKRKFGCTPENAVVCAENMGVYHQFLVRACVAKGVTLFLESPLRIKFSMGLQ
jgi:transposase